jgi:hypothetical protein
VCSSAYASASSFLFVSVSVSACWSTLAFACSMASALAAVLRYNRRSRDTCQLDPVCREGQSLQGSLEAP